MAPDPQTPQKPKRTTEQFETEKAYFLTRLRNEWDIILENPGLPTKGSLEERCLSRVRHLCWTVPIEQSWRRFHTQASEHCRGWVPNYVPGTRQITLQERTEILQCLYRILEEDSDNALKLYQNSPSLSVRSNIKSQAFSDPLKFPLAELKRIRNDMLEHPLKKSKAASLPKRQTGIQSAETSFASNISSVFDSSSTTPNTQLTTFDGCNEDEKHTIDFKSSYYGSSPDIDALTEAFPNADRLDSIAAEYSGGEGGEKQQHVDSSEERILRDRLQSVFGKIKIC